MKKILLCWLAAATALTAGAQSNEWQDAGVNAVNRMPMHGSWFAYESPEAAQTGDKTLSERFVTLNGNWKFNWVRDADQRPTDFFRVGYNDKGWNDMPVPGLWELNGYGDPVYLNVGYAWRGWFKNDPPHVPVEQNHVGSYRRTVDIPAAWAGRQIVAHFGSVTSNIYLWVNGRYVGYSEDSKLEAEFDLTPYVKPGRNLIAFQVFRWCDGTYLEDQDFFRLSGVGRDCYLYARDKRQITDIQVDAAPSADYTAGTVAVKAFFPRQARGCSVELALTDAQGRSVASQQLRVTKDEERCTLDAGKVALWSAETPVLYGLTATLRAPAGEVIEVIPLRIGFRDVKIEGGQLLVNGRPVLIKGANRHEMDPDYGYYVSEGRMLEDIRDYLEQSAYCRTSVDLYMQESSMSETMREEFLSHFQDTPIRTTVGLCVMGGIFGEGIDLKDSRLIGAVVVGTGLPMVCTQNELFRNYFDEKKGTGFNYAYRYPGMNKVLQAAGRVIRTVTDRGAILLLDERFLQNSYQSLFPREWFPYDVVSAESIGKHLSDFWDS